MQGKWRHRIKFIIALTLTFPLFSLYRAAAYACTPPVGGLPNYTIADHVQWAPIVLEGVVVSVDEILFGSIAVSRLNRRGVWTERPICFD